MSVRSLSAVKQQLWRLVPGWVTTTVRVALLIYRSENQDLSVGKQCSMHLHKPSVEKIFFFGCSWDIEFWETHKFTFKYLHMCGIQPKTHYKSCNLMLMILCAFMPIYIDMRRSYVNRSNVFLRNAWVFHKRACGAWRFSQLWVPCCWLRPFWELE